MKKRDYLTLGLVAFSLLANLRLVSILAMSQGSQSVWSWLWGLLGFPLVTALVVVISVYITLVARRALAPGEQEHTPD